MSNGALLGYCWGVGKQLMILINAELQPKKKKKNCGKKNLSRNIYSSLIMNHIFNTQRSKM